VGEVARLDEAVHLPSFCPVVPEKFRNLGRSVQDVAPLMKRSTGELVRRASQQRQQPPVFAELAKQHDGFGNAVLLRRRWRWFHFLLAVVEPFAGRGAFCL
jgi:hypothetical protein